MEKGARTERRHCDDWIHDFQAPVCLRFWLFVNRLPASDKHLCEQNGVIPKLFATYEGKRVRVTMARLGDLGIAYDHDRDTGYDKRGLAIEDLTEYSTTPERP